jgi:hypothetical protein
LIAAIDSYLMQVKLQMQTVDSTQQFGGVLAARDWPLTTPIFGALYLLVLGMNPVGGTEAQAQYEYLLQWVWLLLGDDIAQNQQAENRGNRYRDGMKIVANLRQANFPQFCFKQNYTADAQGNLTAIPVQSTYTFSPEESVYWSRLKFMPRQDQASGVMYGAAAVSLFAWDDVLPALAA